MTRISSTSSARRSPSLPNDVETLTGLCSWPSAVASSYLGCKQLRFPQDLNGREDSAVVLLLLNGL
jgi:hypothetical protein